jgi:amino acid transporter
MRNATKNDLFVTDAVMITVGIIIGAGIFRTPSLIAANAWGGTQMILFWAAGGLISLLGALCFAELASTYPGQGGDYYYINRAFGRPFAFLFAWSRLMVIQTGSIAMLAFIAGDYLSELTGMGNVSSFIAVGLVVLLSAVNITGFTESKIIQRVMVSAIIAGLIVVGFSGLSMTGRQLMVHRPDEGSVNFAKVLIFVLLTYGGWNEAVYLSAEVEKKRMIKVLSLSVAIVTIVYLLVNLAYLKGLGISGMSSTETVAADLMRKAAGENGAKFISLLIAIAAIGTINGSIITGARTAYAVGKDFKLFKFLGSWNVSRQVPQNAVIFQGSMAFLLVIFGSFTRDGFSAMVYFTAPVFWFFFLLSTISLFILRKRDKSVERPFSVPFFPLIPVLFAGICLFMFLSSLKETAAGTLIGVILVLSGLPLFFLNKYISSGRPDYKKE